MSLRDTIDGARREIQDNGGDISAPKIRKKDTEADDAKAQAEAKAEASRLSYYRKSAASAKPSSKAGSSVRTVSGDSSSTSRVSGGGRPRTKEEEKEAKKEAKRRRREQEDFRNQGYEIVLRGLPDYKKYDRVWWVLLVAGFAMAIISLVITYIFSADDYSSGIGLISAVTLVLAYVFIIGAFVFDIIKRRPMRNRAETIVAGMTDKKIADIIRQDREKSYAEEQAKDAAKAAKKAGKK